MLPAIAKDWRKAGTTTSHVISTKIMSSWHNIIVVAGTEHTKRPRVLLILYPIITNPRQMIAGWKELHPLRNCVRPSKTTALPVVRTTPECIPVPVVPVIPVTAALSWLRSGNWHHRRTAPKIALESCNSCKRREQKPSWLKGKDAKVTRRF